MRSFLFTITILCTLFSCKEPFDPPVDDINKNLLVVEGYINTGGGVTTIKLSRTASLQNKLALIPEKYAFLQIETDDGRIIQGSSDVDGTFRISTSAFPPSVKCRLRITTGPGKVYLSDLIENKNTPAIDSISWKIKNDGVEVYANTHDPSNSTRYYGFTYDETWEINSSYPSVLEYKGGKIVDRDPTINIYRCWMNGISRQILLGSTAKLAEDRLTLSPLTYLQGNSLKLSQLYSINVQQYGLSKEAYEYLQNMKKNTEQLGSIFDPQPSEIKGNIHCVTDPDEVVVGFVSAGKISSKRLFISKFQLPGGYEWKYDPRCEYSTTPEDSVDYFMKSGFSLIEKTMGQMGETRYSFSTPVCIDCRLRGSNAKPSFWPN